MTGAMKMKEQKEEKQPARPGRFSILSKIFIVIGILTVLYLFITEVLMRVLAMMTV